MPIVLPFIHAYTHTPEYSLWSIFTERTGEAHCSLVRIPRPLRVAG